MGAGVLLLSALFTGHATLALAVSQQAQAPIPVPQEAAASPASDSSKQATDQGAARPEAGKKDAKPHHKIHVQLGLVSFGLGTPIFPVPTIIRTFILTARPTLHSFATRFGA